MIQQIKTRKWDGNERTVFYDSEHQTYIKQFNYFSQEQWDRITQLVPKAYPNMLLAQEHTDTSMRFVYREIQGKQPDATHKYYDTHSRKRVQRNDQLEAFFVADLNRTWPIAHGDWKYGNVIQSGQQFHMIDFDRISTKYKTKEEAIRDIEKCFYV
tara:strand:+ start:322 stop:789 length:468 start_codon:yes stop_codon:yes gene_type:complete